MDAYTPIQKEFLSILEELEKEESLQSVRGFAADLERLKERMQDDVFRIAVVGEFSSGKSTFINALLGKDVLSHASKETTAVLTQVVNVPQDDPRIGKGLVRCKDGTEQEIRMDELREYTTTVSERHAVAQEIASVDIYTSAACGSSAHADRHTWLEWCCLWTSGSDHTCGSGGTRVHLPPAAARADKGGSCLSA